MKNVKVILIGVALCAAVFANQRIDALGGDSGFWPGDKDNINTFPADINNHGFVEIDGVGGYMGAVEDDPTTQVDECENDLDCHDGMKDGDMSATIVWGDATKWGFSFSEAAEDTWFDLMWGSGDMGIRASLISSTPQSYDNDTTAVDESEGVTGFKLGYGQNFSWGELGVSLMSKDDETSYGVNWRGDLGFWAFDKSKASLVMTDDGAGETSMSLDFDMFTHMDAGGADVLFGLGFGYESMNYDATFDPDTDAQLTYDVAVTRMTLPSATVAVEADMTDWATFRCFVNTNYTVAATNDDAAADPNWVQEGSITAVDTEVTDGYTGSSTTYGFGLGFNWGGLTADLSISENILQDPVSYMTGYEDNTLTSAGVTLTYSF